MSRSWRKRVAVAVYPERLVWLRAGTDGKVAAKGSLTCTAADGVLAAFPQALREADAEGGDVVILLSNRLVRYAIVPNPDSASGWQEIDLLTRHAFERVHGAAVDGWEFRLSCAAPGRAALASAIDRVLVDGLRDAAAGCKARVVSIRPYLMAAYNHSVGRASSYGMFVVVEPQRICQLVWQDKGWLAVQQAYAGEDWQSALPGILDRMVLGLGLESLRDYELCTPEINPSVAPHDTWQRQLTVPRWPQGLSPEQDRAYAGAMLVLD